MFHSLKRPFVRAYSDIYSETDTDARSDADSNTCSDANAWVHGSQGQGSGPGRPGRSLTRGCRRSRRADLPHRTRHRMDSLRDRADCGPCLTSPWGNRYDRAGCTNSSDVIVPARRQTTFPVLLGVCDRPAGMDHRRRRDQTLASLYQGKPVASKARTSRGRPSVKNRGRIALFVT
jgi:hypothetical protein